MPVWGEDYRRGHPLRAEGLAYLLRPYKVRSRQMKIDGINVKGYETAQFSDAFARYLQPPPGTASAVYPSPTERDSEHGGRGVSGYEPVEGRGDQPAADRFKAAELPARIDPNSVEGRYLRLIGEEPRGG